MKPVAYCVGSWRFHTQQQAEGYKATSAPKTQIEPMYSPKQIERAVRVALEYVWGDRTDDEDVRDVLARLEKEQSDGN